MAYEALVPNGIGMTFWALESLMSPYKRIEGRCYDIFDKDLIPDKQLFKALRLTPITTEAKQPSKAVVDALQIILDNEEAEKKAKQHTVYDGKYSIYLYASYRGKREKNIINATIEIKNGLLNISDDSYQWLHRTTSASLDTMRGAVDKEGNFNWSMEIDPWNKGKYLIEVFFKGNLNEDGSITGKYDNDTALRMKLNKIDKKESVKIVETNELFATIEASDFFDGTYSFTLLGRPPDGSLSPIGEGTLEIIEGIITINKDSKGPKYDSFEGRIDTNGDIVASFYFRPCPLGLSLMNCEMEDKSIVFKGGYNDLTNKLHLSGVHDDMSVYFYLTKK